jgi:hypothetical protein
MCKFCLGKENYITPHQASDDTHSISSICGSSLIVKSFKNDKCIYEINVDIKYCPFCGKTLHD